MTKQAAQNSKEFDVLASGRAVIAREVEGLNAVAQTLDDKFVALVERVSDLKGRVIISGMGKSGHIGKKIAATLASTGTPSYFVHPSEASHGDLGMITTDDLVLALSNSGETHELRDIIAYTRRFGIPLVALVRRGESMLAEAADIGIVLPEVPEAGPVGAPTTSTTMMLAFGDALAVALMEKKGFSKNDFGVYHPGGKLGSQLIRVSDLMHKGEELPLVDETMPMEKVLLTMTAKRFGCAGVTNTANEMTGIVTDGDLRRHMGNDIITKTAQQVMTANPVAITPSMLAAEALGIMNSKSITCLFVLNEQKQPVGILHIHDCLRAGIL